jgi:hypothetical protein
MTKEDEVITIRRMLLFAAVVLTTITASADNITWTLVGVTSLGTSITGSFVFNADTTTYSSIDVTTSGGSIIPSETWTNKATFGSFNCCLALVSSSTTPETGLDLLNLVWTPSMLTNAGGTIPLVFTQQGTCNASDCVSFTPYAGDPSGGQNPNVTGYLVASSSASVPEPGSLVLFGSGIIGLAGAVRRKIKL